jgi:FAD/FMN-containing dehydrogenase
VFGQFLGAEAALERLLPGLTRGIPAPRSLTTGTQPWLDLVRRWGGCGPRPLGECTTPEPTAFAAASDYVSRPLSASGLRALRRAIEDRGAASGAILLDAYGGAINRVAPAATAFVHRRMLASCQYYAAGGASARAWVGATNAALAPYMSGSAYQNYIDRDQPRWQDAYYGANLGRLTAVKRRYDPRNLFRFPQSVPPRA